MPAVLLAGLEFRSWLFAVCGERRVWLWLGEVREAMVVLRPIEEVSAEGGGGRLERMCEEGRMEARQRKHSPVP